VAEQQFWFGVHGVIAEHGRIVVLRRAARMTYQPGSWDLPGGHLALGEDFEQCLEREIAEETGLAVAIHRLLGLHKHPDDPYIQAIYQCTLADARREIRLRPDEHVEARWASIAELAQTAGLIPYLERILRAGMLDHLA
jgi:8-oxo-dGTP diphosphatase